MLEDEFITGGDLQEADRFVNELDCGAIKASPAIGTKCKKCEFRVEDKDPSGFAECWGSS